MKLTKRISIILLAILMVISSLVGTLAYLTDRDKGFAYATAGELDILLDSDDLNLLDEDGESLFTPADGRYLDYTVKNSENKSVDIKESIVISAYDSNGYPVDLSDNDPEFWIYDYDDVVHIPGEGWFPESGTRPAGSYIVVDNYVTWFLESKTLNGNESLDEYEEDALGDTYKSDYILIFNPYAGNEFANCIIKFDLIVEGKQHRNTAAYDDNWAEIQVVTHILSNGNSMDVVQKLEHEVINPPTPEEPDDPVVEEKKIFTYSIIDNQVLITGLTDYGKTLSAITVPSEMSGYAVTGINDAAFMNTNIKTISIPNSIVYIGGDAFTNCQKLTSINVISGNRIYSSYNGVLFNNDASILLAYPAGKTSSVYSVPTTVVEIKDAFYNCDKLTMVNIPNATTTINPMAFDDCDNLADIYVNNYTDAIPDAPWGCDATVHWTLGVPEDLGATDIYTYTLDTTNNTATITGLTDMGTKVKHLDIPSILEIDGVEYTVVEIVDGAFASSTATEITIPESVTTLGVSITSPTMQIANFNAANAKNVEYQSAFRDSNIEILNIGESVTTINRSAFDKMKKLTTVNYNAPNITAAISNGNYYAPFGDCPSLTTINIGENVTSIPGYLFYGVASLKNIDIPDSVTRIGNYAFAATGLTSVNVSSNVTTIGTYMFANCKSLTEATVNTKSISNYMFQNCTALTTVNMNGVTQVGNSAFEGCTSLTAFDFTDIKTIGSAAFKGSGLTGDLVLPASVTSINASAFQNCTGLTSITFGSGITRLNYGTLINGCTSITDVYVPSTVTTISNTAFKGVDGITIHYAGTATGSPWGATNATIVAN